MKVWWVQTPSPGNYGDILTPRILQHFGLEFTQGSSQNFDTICIGSIAKVARAGTRVLGSGVMNLTDKLNPLAVWEFVRGPITRDRILELGGQCPEIYGDPAMLLPLLCPESRKSTDIGIVPHYVDYKYVKEMYPQYRVINLLNANPMIPARQITSCRYIISSSLHGIITAHAYGIPAAWMTFTGRLKGDNSKFLDHYRAMGLELHLSTWKDLRFSCPENYSTDAIENVFRTLAYEQQYQDLDDVDFS